MKYTPSEAELEILQILWRIEPATVRQIHETIEATKAVGYTTTLKQVQRLFEKGILERVSSGRTHLYTAVFKEKEVKNNLVDKFKNNVFKGSALDLVLFALGEDKTDMEDIEVLERFIQTYKKQQKDAL